MDSACWAGSSDQDRSRSWWCLHVCLYDSAAIRGTQGAGAVVPPPASLIPVQPPCHLLAFKGEREREGAGVRKLIHKNATWR